MASRQRVENFRVEYEEVKQQVAAKVKVLDAELRERWEATFREHADDMSEATRELLQMSLSPSQWESLGPTAAEEPGSHTSSPASTTQIPNLTKGTKNE